jgi:hypothetical protein
MTTSKPRLDRPPVRLVPLHLLHIVTLTNAARQVLVMQLAQLIVIQLQPKPRRG